MRDRLTTLGVDVDQYQRIGEQSDRLVISATIPVESYRPIIVLPDQSRKGKKRAKPKTKSKAKSKRGVAKNAKVKTKSKTRAKSRRIKPKRSGRRHQGRNRKGK
jgi:hypothetical protein